MKFMKLGSKPDTFQTEDNNIRYVASELATDVVIQVGDIKFYLHKFPLLSKSACLQKLVSSSSEDEIILDDVPGGPAAFEACAKFCYGMIITLNAYNVVPTRCAAEYLEMQETVDKGNLVYKLDVFLTSSIFRSWKDSIIVLHSAKSLFPFAEELKIVSQCVEAIASKASTDVSKVDWSYTYNRKKAVEENGNGLRTRAVPLDWWAEDLSELDIDLYKWVIVCVKNKGLVPSEVIGEALKAYTYLKLPATGKNNVVPQEDLPKICSIIENVVWLLPAEKGCVTCSFLLKLLKAAVSADSDERVKSELVRRVGQQLEEASVNDLLIPACEGGESMYDVEIVWKILEEFVTKDRNFEIEMENQGEIQEIGRPGILSEASKLMVAKLVDGYLAEISKDPNLPLSSFVGISEMVSGFSRPAHDGLYRAIDTYLKEHPGISKSERKRICRLMDCKKLSAETCMHAVQNERLPLRVVVQVLFFEQARAAASSSGGSTPDLPKAIKDLTCNNSHGSSRSATTNTDEDWDALASADELRALRGELAALRMGNGVLSEEVGRAGGPGRGAIGKLKSLIVSRRIFSKIWSGKGGSNVENSGSDSSESLGSGHNNNINNQNSHDEGKSTVSRRGRHSVS